MRIAEQLTQERSVADATDDGEQARGVEPTPPPARRRLRENATHPAILAQRARQLGEMLRRGLWREMNRQLIECFALGEAPQHIRQIRRCTNAEEPALEWLGDLVRGRRGALRAIALPRTIHEDQQQQQAKEDPLHDRDDEHHGTSHAAVIPPPPLPPRRHRSNQDGIFAMRMRRFTGFGT